MYVKLSIDHIYLLADKLIPGLPILSRFSNKWTRVSKETLLIDIYSVDYTGYILLMIMNGGEDPAFHHLSTGPIWEPRLRVTCPTPFFTFGRARFVVA